VLLRLLRARRTKSAAESQHGSAAASKHNIVWHRDSNPNLTAGHRWAPKRL
jgi:hypothetical protein